MVQEPSKSHRAPGLRRARHRRVRHGYLLLLLLCHLHSSPVPIGGSAASLMDPSRETRPPPPTTSSMSAPKRRFYTRNLFLGYFSGLKANRRSSRRVSEQRVCVGAHVGTLATRGDLIGSASHRGVFRGTHRRTFFFFFSPKNVTIICGPPIRPQIITTLNMRRVFLNTIANLEFGKNVFDG